MIRRRPSRLVAVGLVAVGLTGCGSDGATPSRPGGAPTSPASTSTGASTAPGQAAPPGVSSAPDSAGGPGNAGVPNAVTPDAVPPDTVAPDTSPTAAGWPPYEATVSPVSVARLGPTWRPGCPVGADELRLLRLTYATPDGTSATGELVVAADAAEDFVSAFGELYAARFPITRMQTIDVYGADDDASMAADNTSAFNCRDVTGGTGWSRHAYGVAVDINPLLNPYVEGQTVLPPAGRAYLDRADVRPGMIVAGDVVVAAFTSRGFEWGGDFRTLKDYQHFAR